MTLPNVIPRRRLGATTPAGIGNVIVVDVKKNCVTTIIMIIARRKQTNVQKRITNP